MYMQRLERETRLNYKKRHGGGIGEQQIIGDDGNKCKTKRWRGGTSGVGEMEWLEERVYKWGSTDEENNGILVIYMQS